MPATPAIIALTGGIASGKTALERAFAELGIHIADADKIARDIVEPGQPALTAIVNLFGKEILAADGSLNRSTLRSRIFNHPEERLQLETILHPKIRDHLLAQCQAATSPYVIAVIPLLAEAGGRKHYPWLNRILVVDVAPEIQLARLIQRDGIDTTLAEKMIAAQASRQQRLAIADDIIVNHTDLQTLTAAAKTLHPQYERLQGASP